MGFFKSVMEHDVFYKRTAANGVMYLSLYVDDILLISVEHSEIDASIESKVSDDSLGRGQGNF